MIWGLMSEMVSPDTELNSCRKQGFEKSTDRETKKSGNILRINASQNYLYRDLKRVEHALMSRCGMLDDEWKR